MEFSKGGKSRRREYRSFLAEDVTRGMDIDEERKVCRWMRVRKGNVGRRLGKTLLGKTRSFLKHLTRDVTIVFREACYCLHSLIEKS